MFWYVALAVIVVGTALAWWSSGKSGPFSGRRRTLSQTEKDAMAGHQHSAGVLNNNGGGMF